MAEEVKIVVKCNFCETEFTDDVWKLAAVLQDHEKIAHPVEWARKKMFKRGKMKL